MPYRCPCWVGDTFSLGAVCTESSPTYTTDQDVLFRRPLLEMTTYTDNPVMDLHQDAL